MSISVVPFPVFMTINMTIFFALMGFANSFIDKYRSHALVGRLGYSIFGAIKMGGLAFAGMCGLFVIAWLGSLASIEIWALVEPFVGSAYGD